MRSSYLATGPDARTITLDDTVIYFTDLEPITDNTTVRHDYSHVMLTFRTPDLVFLVPREEVE